MHVSCVLKPISQVKVLAGSTPGNAGVMELPLGAQRTWFWMRSFTRSMGAAAVFETAAETPPTARRCQYHALPSRIASSYRPHCGARDTTASCSCCCRQLVEGPYVLMKSTTKPGIPTVIHGQLCNNAETRVLATPGTRCHHLPITSREVNGERDDGSSCPSCHCRRRREKY
jgi:hypothetical protein